MPKRYADSITHDLKKYDQLKRAYKAQEFEIDYAYLVIESKQKEAEELDSLNSANVDYYENYELPKHRRRVFRLGVVALVELLLLLLVK